MGSAFFAGATTSTWTWLDRLGPDGDSTGASLGQDEFPGASLEPGPLFAPGKSSDQARSELREGYFTSGLECKHTTEMLELIGASFAYQRGLQ